MIDFTKEPSVNDDFTADVFSFDDVAAALKPITATVSLDYDFTPPAPAFTAPTTITLYSKMAVHPSKRRRNGVHHRQKARWVPVVTTFPIKDVTYTWGTS